MRPIGVAEPPRLSGQRKGCRARMIGLAAGELDAAFMKPQEGCPDLVYQGLDLRSHSSWRGRAISALHRKQRSVQLILSARRSLASPIKLRFCAHGRRRQAVTNRADRAQGLNICDVSHHLRSQNGVRRAHSNKGSERRLADRSRDLSPHCSRLPRSTRECERRCGGGDADRTARGGTRALRTPTKARAGEHPVPARKRGPPTGSKVPITAATRSD